MEHHLITLSQAKRPETREFYRLAAIRNPVAKARARTPNPVARDPAERPCGEESVTSGDTKLSVRAPGWAGLAAGPW